MDQLYRQDPGTKEAAQQRYEEKHRKQHQYWDACRHPRTQNERRLTDGHLADEDVRFFRVKIRKARKPAHLPTWYDDLRHSQYSHVEHYKPWRSKKQRRALKTILEAKEQEYGLLDCSDHDCRDNSRSGRGDSEA